MCEAAAFVCFFFLGPAFPPCNVFAAASLPSVTYSLARHTDARWCHQTRFGSNRRTMFQNGISLTTREGQGRVEILFLFIYYERTTDSPKAINFQPSIPTSHLSCRTQQLIQQKLHYTIRRRCESGFLWTRSRYAQAGPDGFCAPTCKLLQVFVSS